MATVVESDLKAPFSIATTQRCCEGRHCTHDPYLIMPSAKLGGIKYHFWVFGMTQPGIEPRFPMPLTKNNFWMCLHVMKLIPCSYILIINCWNENNEKTKKKPATKLHNWSRINYISFMIFNNQTFLIEKENITIIVIYKCLWVGVCMYMCINMHAYFNTFGKNIVIRTILLKWSNVVNTCPICNGIRVLWGQHSRWT